MNDSEGIRHSVNYLSSPAALESLVADAYWPKWDSPWWHMLLLHEMGETSKIPQAAVDAHVASLNRIPVKIFPIQPEDMPAGVDPYRGTSCHCQLGNVYQVLAARGVDVDRELPWIRPWILRYQMADGGLNCDNEAYLVKDEVPSSMVGTIAVFEAILWHTHRPWTEAERRFVDAAAGFLIGRRLIEGSSTRHNAAERESAKDWPKLCFPRFYFYDVLRGLNALLSWSEKTGGQIPLESVREAVTHLAREFPDDQVRIGRFALDGTRTLLRSASGEWTFRHPATHFPLLDQVSRVGEVSPYLTRRWLETKAMLSRNSSLRGLIE